MRPGGVVIERTFAEALGIGAGARITLNGQRFTVAGIAVTAANPPYPNLCDGGGGGCHGGFSGQLPARDVGLIWATTPDAGKLATAANPISSYVLNLRLTNPASAQTFANRYSAAVPGVHPLGPVSLATRQGIAAADGLLP